MLEINAKTNNAVFDPIKPTSFIDMFAPEFAPHQQYISTNPAAYFAFVFLAPQSSMQLTDISYAYIVLSAILIPSDAATPSSTFFNALGASSFEYPNYMSEQAIAARFNIINLRKKMGYELIQKIEWTTP